MIEFKRAVPNVLTAKSSFGLIGTKWWKCTTVAFFLALNNSRRQGQQHVEVFLICWQLYQLFYTQKYTITTSSYKPLKSQ